MATKTSTLYGLLAEFDREDQVVDATRRIYEAGYRRIDAYAPFPVHGLAEAMGRKRTWVPTVVLAGGVMGGSAGSSCSGTARWSTTRSTSAAAR